MDGWIKLHRIFLDWEWFKDSKMVHLFAYLLLNANHKDGKWQGIDIKRGQLITGRKKINEETGISEQSIRTCINRLKSTSEITIKSTSKHSIITICNYDKYNDYINDINQHNNQHTNQPSTSNQPASNHKQEEEKNVKKEEKEEEQHTFIPPKLEDVKRYFKEKGYTDIAAERAFNHYDTLNWINAHGKPVLNWKNTMGNNWFKDENKDKTKVIPDVSDRYTKITMDSDVK